MKSQINIGRLLDQEFIDRDDELLCDLLKADSNGRTPRSLNQKNLMKLFRLSNFRADFAKKQLVKKNYIQFVWPKYVVSEVYRGRSQLISSLAFDDDESFIEKLSSHLIKEYLMIYCVVYQNDDNFKEKNIDELLEYSLINNINPIIKFQQNKNLNNLLQDFYSFVFIYAKDYQIYKRDSKFYSNFLVERFLHHYYNCYRNNNAIVPIHKYSNSIDTNKISKLMDYAMCLSINLFVLFKKPFQFLF